MVVGCGPVGLAVIAGLRLAGVESIVAADLSPVRRGLARTMGATEAVDPRSEPVVEAWRRLDGRRPLVAFEAVGVPGMLQQLLRDLPPGTRITVVGVCMETDEILPFFAIAKELSLQFALAYVDRRIRRRAARHRRGRRRRGPHDDRRRWTSTACPEPSRRWPDPMST